MAFRNEITAGTTLIREAIQSQNYEQGVSGWIISADGNAEFNSVVIRGGTVVSGTALYYDGPPGPGTLFLSIAAAAGVDDYGNAYEAGLTMGKPGVRQVRLTYDAVGGYVDLPFNDPDELTAGYLATRRDDAGLPTQRLFAELASAHQTVAGGAAAVRVISGSLDATIPPRVEIVTDAAGVTDSVMMVDAQQVQILPDIASAVSVLYVEGPAGHLGNLLRLRDNATDRLIVTAAGVATLTGSLTASGYVRAQNFQSGTESVSFVALSSTTIAVAFDTAFPVGVVPVVTTNIASSAGVTARWGSRAYNITNTGFTLFLFEGDSADPAQTWANIPVQWFAHSD